MCFLLCMSVPRLYKWLNSFKAVTSNCGRGTRTSKLGDSHVKYVVEELEVSVWRLNVWLDDFIYMWYLECVIQRDCYSSRVNKPVKTSADRLGRLVWRQQCNTLIVVTTSRLLLNQSTNPNPVFSQWHTWQYEWERREMHTEFSSVNMEAQTGLRTWMRLDLLHYDRLQAGCVFIYDSTNKQRRLFEQR
jgi:hypothetical protein